jgi:hypothetical protein
MKRYTLKTNQLVWSRFKKNLFLFTLTALSSCQNIATPVVVNRYDRTQKLHRKFKFYYSSFNFVLEPNGRLFYHKKDSVVNCCDTGMDLNYPDYIDLRPEDFTECTNADFQAVVDSAKQLSPNDKNSIQLSLYTDTLWDTRIQQLLSILKEKGFFNFDMRKATEEEIVVLAAKLQHQPYDFYRVAWKSRFSQTLFPPPPPTYDSSSRP